MLLTILSLGTAVLAQAGVWVVRILCGTTKSLTNQMTARSSNMGSSVLSHSAKHKTVLGTSGM